MSMQPGMGNSTSLERLLEKAGTCLLAWLVVAAISFAGCAGQNAIRPDLDRAAVATETVAVAGVETRATATPTAAPPSPTSSPLPPAKPATPTRPATSSLNPPAAPSGLEPTAAPTATPPTLPTPSPTPTPVPTSSVVPGWLTYENDLLGYSFSYPPEAEIGAQGVGGFPPEELPENMTTEAYLEYLQSIYPGGLCVSVQYKRGFLTVFPRGETGVARYVGGCGITGVGDYTIENWEEVITIDGGSHTASGHKLYIWETDQLEEEFYILLDINGNLRIDFGVHWRSTTPKSGQGQLSEQEYNEIRETLLQILASFRFFPPQTGDG